tara:strand:- start:1245 stop:1685 length:441 start_codon:yes stop_codon:yes gene_type:complete
MPIKSFRALMTDGSIDTISLHTNTGSTGYRIKRMNLMPNTPGVASAEYIVKVYSVPQTTADATVDFSDNTLLAAGYFTDRSSSGPAQDIVVFDTTTFNQDIFVTLVTNESNNSCNYYIELEQVKLALDENTVATLKDIRNIEQPSV